MRTLNRALVAVLAAAFSAANAADMQSVALSHYEPLYQLELRTVAAGAANASLKAQAAPFVMSFKAMGRSFDLDLEPNRRLLAAARNNPALDAIEIYRGSIPGKPGSWARIVVSNGIPSGMIWDGNEMFAIEAPGDSLAESAETVIYRLADVQVAPGAVSCGSGSGSMAMAMSGSQVLSNLVGELGTKAEAQGAIDEIGMGAIGDFEFTSNKGGDVNAAAAIATRLNNVDGIFSAELGIQITVNTIETFSNANDDPFSNETDAGLLLDEVSEYRSTNPNQNRNGLTHLYTGKDLNGTTVGVAWTGALCSNFFGAGLSEGNGSATFDSLVAAHEIGHNFGAPHDGEAGSPCASETGEFLMAPRLNGSQAFSQCSKDEMADDIARASCITALPAVDMRPMLTSGASVLFGSSAVLSYDVENVGSIDATGVTADFTIPANLTLDSISISQGTCTSDASSASCNIGDVPGQTARTVDLAVTPVSIGSGTITADVAADVDERLGNNQEALQLSVDPAVDLAVSVPSGFKLRLDNSTTVSATLENRSELDATGVAVTLSLGNSLEATAASWPLGNCVVNARSVTCQVSRFAAQSSTTVSVTATGVSAGTPRITYAISSVEPDLAPNDNTGTVRIEVRDPDESSGSTGPLFLWLLSLAALVRRRR